GLQATHNRYQLQPGAHGTLCVVLVGLGVTEVDQNAVAHVLRHEATEALYRVGDALLVGGDDLSQIFGVHASREGRGADEVGKHHRHLAALGVVFGRGAWGTRCGRCVKGRRPTARVVTQSSDGIQEFHTVTERGNAKLLQVLVRQARENRLVYV